MDCFGGSRIPIGVTYTLARCYQNEVVSYTQAEALELAYAQLDAELAAISGDVQLLRKEIVTEWNEDSVRLVCKLSCIENIAVQSEIEMTE